MGYNINIYFIGIDIVICLDTSSCYISNFSKLNVEQETIIASLNTFSGSTF
jgi:hypothetical protein